jgi:hypothetical protein
MATQKTFSVAGTTRHPNGTVKIRFANDLVSRLKTLVKNGHTEIELIELGDEYTKADICQVLMQHDRFQSEEQQTAIVDFVVRNCKTIANELATKAAADEELDVEVDLENS